MRVRWLGHSCIEILGEKHIVIDPDFLRDPLAGVDYVLVTHGHDDHMGKVALIPTGKVLASQEVCEIARREGVSPHRLVEVAPGDMVDNVQVLEGYSQVGKPSDLWARVWGRRRRLPGGKPVSFLVHNDLSLLHIGDAFEFPLECEADILCLPYRRVPFRQEYYQRNLVELAVAVKARYIIPVHFDMSPWGADPRERQDRLSAKIIVATDFVELKG